MCGIAGIVTWGAERLAARDIDAMTTRLRHRGPDGIGADVEDRFALGHTRLAVIDLEGGAQPMTTADGRVSITYNGEIYNFRALRSELERAGSRFRTVSDTEVILEAWRAWGPRCVERFRGMFAFAVVDRDRREVFVARDPHGIKPLVYFHDREEFSFASGLDALRTRPRCPTEVSLDALDHYLALSYIPAPLTVFRGVKKLLPAHHLTVDMDSGRSSGPIRYWSLSFDESPERRPEEWARELEHVLRESVRAHLVSDVPVGAFLSGGVDSSLIVSLMAEEMGEPVRTFSIGFDEERFDESRFARQVAERWGTTHREKIVTPDALAVLPELVTHHGEPFGDWSSIPTFHLAALAREDVPVVLSGDGGDEGFAGYDRYAAWLACSPSDAGSAMSRRLKAFLRRGRENGGGTDGWESHAMLVMRAPDRRRLWREELAPALPASFDIMEQAVAETGSAGRLDRARGVDLLTYLPGAILTKVDVASMYHGLEVRTPLIDREVLEFAARVPRDLLIRPLPDGRSESKHLLRQLLRCYFPAPFVERPKRGFIPPVAEWLAPGNPMRAAVEDRLLGSDTRLREYFRPTEVKRVIDDLGRGGPAEPAWLLLFLEYWLEADQTPSRLPGRP